MLAELAQSLSGSEAHLRALVLPDHTATSSPTSVQTASLATDCNCRRPGPCFELRFPQLCPCLRSCQCSQTTPADVYILVRKGLRQRRHGRGRVLAEVAQSLSGRAAHLRALVLPDHTATSSPTSAQTASLALGVSVRV